MGTKLPLIAVALLVMSIIGVYVVNQKSDTEELSQATSTVESIQEQTSTSSSATAEDTEVSEVPAETVVPKENSDGIHIMADGKVINKEGKEVIGAKILANGTIQLSDGTIVTPAFDLRTNTTGATQSPVSNHVVIDVVGTDFVYDIKQIKVKKGDTVTINFKSNEGFHDWVIDEFDASTERVTEKDGVTSVTFVADKVGTFQYYCSVMNHRQMGMIGYLTVEEK